MRERESKEITQPLSNSADQNKGRQIKARNGHEPLECVTTLHHQQPPLLKDDLSSPLKAVTRSVCDSRLLQLQIQAISVLRQDT